MNICTNSSEQFEDTTHENVGFRGKKGQKAHPNLATNIPWNFIGILSVPPKRGLMFPIRLSSREKRSATKMTGRPGHWSEPGEYNILFLGSILVISSQDSSALGYREFTQEGAMTISPFAAREGTSAPQWPNVKNVVVTSFRPVSDFFVQSYAVPKRREKACTPEPSRH